MHIKIMTHHQNLIAQARNNSIIDILKKGLDL